MAIRKSAMGKAVDMASLVSKNEHVRAVGNMNVNARGDTIDSNNRIVNDNNSRISRIYKKGVSGTRPDKSHSSPVSNKQLPVTEMTAEEREFEDQDEDFVKEEEAKKAKNDRTEEISI